MAFKMKGNPLKMGSWATKSTMKMRESSPLHQEITTRPEEPDVDAGYVREDEYTEQPLTGGSVKQPKPEDYPGPENVSDVKEDAKGLYFETDDGKYYIPKGAEDYTGPIGEGASLDETWLEEFFGMPQE
jgi:hypothetical protein